MNLLCISAAFLLLIAIAAGMIRILAGPTAADRMLAPQLFGTCGVAILLLFAKGLGIQVLLDVALVFALLAALATTTFVRRAWQGCTDSEKKEDQY